MCKLSVRLFWGLNNQTKTTWKGGSSSKWTLVQFILVFKKSRPAMGDWNVARNSTTIMLIMNCLGNDNLVTMVTCMPISTWVWGFSLIKQTVRQCDVQLSSYSVYFSSSFVMKDRWRIHWEKRNVPVTAVWKVHISQLKQSTYFSLLWFKY